MPNDFKAKLEYVLTQVCPYDGLPAAEMSSAYALFESLVDECCKLNLLPDGAYARFVVLALPKRNWED